MNPLLDFGSGYVLLFTLVLVRVSGIVLVAPIFGTNEIPSQIRALLVVALTLLITPTISTPPPSMPRSLVDFGLICTGELLVGLLLGLGITVFFTAFQVAGSMIGQLSGMSLGDVFNPALDESVPLFSHLLHLLTTAVYVLIGGHRLLLGGLLDTFVALPPGSALVPVGIEQLLVDLLSEAFGLGLRAAAPAASALLLATIVLGLISRSLPQLNVLALGFGLNAMVTFSVLSVSLAGAAWLVQDRLEPTFTGLMEAVVHPSAAEPQQ
jgi:flagellar biosynthetic protein FliR